MSLFRMRHFLFSLLLCVSCASDYKNLRAIPVDEACLKRINPQPLQTSWYDVGIDVTGKHISGLLLIKNMPDSSDRVVFTNEAGVKFLDFEWKENGDFRVYHVISQLNKKAVIGLLRKDFELMISTLPENAVMSAWRTDKHIFYGFDQKKETTYFITGAECASLLRVESGSKRKRKVSMWHYGENKQQPDSILLQHHTFAMAIRLRKLVRE